MGLETGTYVSDLVITNPVGATDERRFGDDHLRLIKSVLKNTFPDGNAAMRALRFEHRSSDTGALAVADKGKYIVADVAYTQSFNTAAVLGSGWWCMFRNNSFVQGTRVGLQAPINGLAGGFQLYPGEDVFISTDGISFFGFGTGSRVLLDWREGTFPLGIEFGNIGDLAPRFKIFQVEWDNLTPATFGVEFWMRTSANNGVSWDVTPTYQHVRHYISTLSENSAMGVVNDTKVVFATGFPNNATTNGVVRIAPFANRCRWALDYVPQSAALALVNGWSTINAANAVQFIFSSGGAAVGTGGIVRLYGLS